MALVTLLSQTGVAAPAPGGIGPILAFPGSDNIRTFQINVASGPALTATLVIQGSNKPSPGASDFQNIATITFTGHTTNFSMDVETNFANVQVIVSSITTGQVAVFGDSRTGALTGSSGTTLSLATAVIASQLKVGVTGQFVHVSAPVVPAITSDDVTFALDFSRTVTDELVDLKDFVEPIVAASVDTADIALLSGKAAFGLTNADLCKLADIDASASEVNFSVGVTSGIQAQLDAITSGFVTGPGVDLTGLNAIVSATSLNTFFDVAATISLSTVESALSGLSATAADLNALAGTAGDVFAADFVKLGDITASAAEINVLNGLTASAAELNVLAGFTGLTADLNAIDGLAASGVSVTELAFLSGLTENVQAALNTITPLVGLTASVGDLNLLTGALAGTGAFAGGAISSAEIAFLDGLTANIQTQLDSKRNTADTIGIAEITGSSITTTELNFLSGAVSNIQAQIDAIGTGFLSVTGGTMTGPLCIADGVAAAPGLCLASSATTGLYLEGAPGVGLTVAGTRFSSWDGAVYRVGGAVSIAEPIMRGSGFAETDPQFAFAGDDDTGMFWVGADILGFSAAGERMLELDGASSAVTVGGPAATNNSVTISGVFDGEKLLGVTTGLDATVSADTAIYTVPAGRSAVVTKILVLIETAVVGGGSTATLRMNIGFTGALFDELVDNVNNTLIFNPAGYSFDTALQVMPLGYGDNAFPAIAGSAGADYQALTAGAVLTASVQTPSDFTTLTFRIAAFGYEF